MKNIIKNIVLVFSLILIFTGCRTTHIPSNPNPDTDIPINRNALLRNVNNIDSFFYDNTKITIFNPYKNKGKLELKGSMHNHTHNSDSPDAEPVSTAIKFRDKGGFDFYTFTDHNFVTFDPGVPGIVWMGNAMEYSSVNHHVNIYNLPTGYEYVNVGDDIHELIKYAKNLGAIVSYNHPYIKNRYTKNPRPTDRIIETVKNLDFIEMYNAGTNLETVFDLKLSEGTPILGFAGDDYHFNRAWLFFANFQFNKTYIIAYADEKNKESIWKALLCGSFYMVRGKARMDISCDNGIIKVLTDKPSKFEFIGLNAENPRNGKILHSVNNTKEASYAINGTEGYIRVRMTNSSGAAFSQAFFILAPSRITFKLTEE